MMCFVIPVVLILFIIALGILGTWAMEEDRILIFISTLVLGVAMVFGAIGFTINAFDYSD